jgi:hypothetical protein
MPSRSPIPQDWHNQRTNQSFIAVMAASHVRNGVTHTTLSYDPFYHFKQLRNAPAHALDMVLDSIYCPLGRNELTPAPRLLPDMVRHIDAAHTKTPPRTLALAMDSRKASTDTRNTTMT